MSRGLCVLMDVPFVDEGSFRPSKGAKLAYHPSSLVILGLWVAYIICLVVDLELSVRHKEVDLSEHLPWRRMARTSQLLTVFAQGHGAVTSIHLGRLAMSSLQDPLLAPKTWAELFWAADHNWQGPVGISHTLGGKFRLRRKISFTFLLFAATSLMAIFTPTALDRAYSRDLNLMKNTTQAVRMDTFDRQSMNRRPMNTSVAELQLAVGGAAWTPYGQFDDMYHWQTYYGQKTQDNTFDDRLITANLADFGTLNGRLRGLEIIGDCHPKVAIYDQDSWCRQHDLDAHSEEHKITFGGNNTVSSDWCTDFNATLDQNLMERPDGHTMTVFA
jgi:hypothetical protein